MINPGKPGTVLFCTCMISVRVPDSRAEVSIATLDERSLSPPHQIETSGPLGAVYELSKFELIVFIISRKVSYIPAGSFPVFINDI